MRVGDLEILPVHDGVARFQVAEAFETMPPEAWAPHRKFLTDDGELELALGGFLLRTGDHVVVIDCGVGAVTSGPFHGGAFLTSLAAHGVDPAEVTDVLFTHLHFDHVGWSTQQGRVVFPHATYRCDERDWAHFVGPDPGATRKLSPLTDRMELWSQSGPVLPGLDLLLAPGHTPGSTMMVVSSKGERAMLLGDVVHCPVELIEDEWAAIGDVDPVLAAQTRERVSRELDGAEIGGAHFPGLTLGRLITTSVARRWTVP